MKKLILLITLIFTNISAYAYDEKDLHIDEFGTYKKGPIESWEFFFYDGEYIPPPYTVERRGLGVFVNGKMVLDPIKWPVKFEVYDGRKDPGELPKLTKEDDFDTRLPSGEKVIEFIEHKQDYYHHHYPKEEAIKKTIELYKSLPFVKKIIKFDKKNCKIELECIDGGFLYFYVGPFADELPPEYYEYWKKENIIKRLNNHVDFWVSNFQGVAGCATFFFSCGYEVGCPSEDFLHLAPLFIEVIESDLSDKEKIRIIKNIELLGPDPDDDVCEMLIKNFKPTKKLKKMVKELAEEMEVKPMTWKDIPKENPSEMWRRYIITNMVKKKKEEIVKAREEYGTELYEDEFGCEKIKIKSNDALFFYNGEYVPPPYIAERRGLGVFINGRQIIWPFVNWKVERLALKGKEKEKRKREIIEEINKKAKNDFIKKFESYGVLDFMYFPENIGEKLIIGRSIFLKKMPLVIEIAKRIKSVKERAKLYKKIGLFKTMITSSYLEKIFARNFKPTKEFKEKFNELFEKYSKEFKIKPMKWKDIAK